MERLQKLALALMAVVVVICCIGAYSTYSKCKAEGGIPVRGFFGLECIK
jgi:hypothetical protein